MSVGASTRNNTTFCWVSRSCDFMVDTSEVGDISSTIGDGEAVSSIGRYHLTVLGPIGEVIVFIGRSCQCAGLKVVVGSSTCDCAAYRRIGCRCDLIAVKLEVGDILGGTGYGYGALCLLDAVGPTDEGVAFVGYGCESDFIKVVVGSSTCSL